MWPGWPSSWAGARGRCGCWPTEGCVGWPSGWTPRSASRESCNAGVVGDALMTVMFRLVGGSDRADLFALDDRTVERLLAGRSAPADVPPAYAGVARLLAAAAAPPSPEEFAGQAAA